MCPCVCLSTKSFIFPSAFTLIGPLSTFARMPPPTLVLPLCYLPFSFPRSPPSSALNLTLIDCNEHNLLYPPPSIPSSLSSSCFI